MSDYALPHTLDNLCNEDKKKLIGMIKELNEGKRKCTLLEQQIEGLNELNKQLKNHEISMKKQLEDMESKVFEAVDASKAADNQVQYLTSELQKSEFNRKSARSRYRESQGEITSLKDSIHALKQKYEKTFVDAEIQTKILYCTRTTNTFDTALRLDDADIQCTIEEDALRSKPKIMSYTVSQTTMEPESMTSTTWNESPSYVEPDDDLARLIMSLND